MLLELLVCLVNFACYSGSKELQAKCEFIKSFEYLCKLEEWTDLSDDFDEITSVTGNSESNLTMQKTSTVVTKGNHRITHLPIGLGIVFPELRRLIFTNSALKFIKRENFAGMVKLNFLVLMSNSIETLPEDVFNDLNLLSSLKLDRNLIKVLPEDIFDQLEDLIIISLNNNPIEFLPENIFESNFKLKAVSLRNLRLTKIMADVSKLIFIVSLDLRDNVCINTTYHPILNNLNLIQGTIRSKCQ